MFQFLGNVADGLPGVGHVKGMLHYTFGDTDGGNKAMYEATRSTAVIAGGVIGAVGGPAGAIAGATGAGFVADSLCSIATQQPQGVVEGLGDVASDIFIHHKLPVKSVLKTGVLAAADMASGLGAGGFHVGIKEVTKTSVKKVVEVSSTTLLVAGMTTPRAEITSSGRQRPSRGDNINSGNNNSGNNNSGNNNSGNNNSGNNNSGTENNDMSRSTQRSSSRRRTANNNNSSNTSSGSGSERPNNNRNNRNNTCNHSSITSEEIMALRLLFNGVPLEDISLCGKHIFKNLTPGQIDSLVTLIRTLQRNRHLDVNIRVVVYVCENISPAEVNFQNFLSISEFVNVYLEEQFTNYIQWNREIRLERVCFNAREEVVERLFIRCRNTIVAVINSLRERIANFNFTAYFRDIYSAFYHYYKHRTIPNSNRVIEINEYLTIIETMMSRVREYTEYKELSNRNHPRTNLIFERYYNIFYRRVRIVLRSYQGRVTLSSCFVIDRHFQNDRDGDEFIINDED